jgi:hypothetical protein
LALTVAMESMGDCLLDDAAQYTAAALPSSGQRPTTVGECGQPRLPS